MPYKSITKGNQSTMAMKIVKITWIDAIGVTPDWEHKDDIKPMKPVIVTSVGYLLDDNKEYKTILQSDSDDVMCGRLTIPVCCIKKIMVL